MRIAVVAYEGFNELDVFGNLHMLSRASRLRPQAGIKAELTCVSPSIRSMYGVRVDAQRPMTFVQEASVVIIGSGGTLAATDDAAFMSQLRLDPRRQMIGSQCSGALVLHKLGLLAGSPACTDVNYRPRLEAEGVHVLDQPFFASGNTATAGGCLSAAHLSAWVLWRTLGADVAALTLQSVAAVGDQSHFAAQVLQTIAPYIPQGTEAAA
jgi:transcriptional regulator GlxA family with amidase domain